MNRFRLSAMRKTGRTLPYQRIVAVLWLLPAMALAKLTVVALGDNALCAAPYVKPLPLLSASQGVGWTQTHASELKQAQGRLARSVTPSPCPITEGKVVRHFEPKLKALAPFFMFSNTPRDLWWLEQNVAFFRRHRAVGFLVNSNAWVAKTLAQRYQIAIVPVSCDGLQRDLQTQHLPLFMQAGWVQP